MIRNKSLVIALAALLLAAGCGGGGGGSSNDGIVLEGTLIQGGGASHERVAPKHSAGEPIGAVQICALGSCSTTDDTGHWGFLAEGEFTGGDVLFTVVGHGIDTTSVVNLPTGAKNAVLDFVNNSGTVSAHTVVVDGIEQGHTHAEGDAEHDHDA